MPDLTKAQRSVLQFIALSGGVPDERVQRAGARDNVYLLKRRGLVKLTGSLWVTTRRGTEAACLM